MKEHPKYKGWYADENGYVYHNDVLIRGCRTQHNYRQIFINKKSILVHRFVYECLNNVILQTNEIINHLDCNGQNNHIINLELTNANGNIGWHWGNKLRYNIKQSDMLVKEQHQNSMAKITREQAKEVIMLTLSGKTNNEIGEIYNLHPRYISLIRHKKRWKKVWIELGLEGSETIPSGSRHEAVSKWCQP